jgi:hypothetical protein
MFSQIKIGKFQIEIWWTIFFFFQLSLIGFMIATLLVYPWITLHGPNGKSFNGGLYKCVEGCDFSYSELEKTFCTPLFVELENVYHSLCLLFKTLQRAYVIYLVFEILSIIGVFFWVIFMLLCLKKIKFIRTTYFFSVCAFVCHFIAMSGWLGTVQADFAGHCNDFPNDGSQPMVCADAGPKLGIFVLIFMAVGVITYIIVAYEFNAIRNLIYPDRSFRIDQPIEMNHQIVHNPGPATEQRLPYNPEERPLGQNPIVDQNPGIQNSYKNEVNQISIPPADELNQISIPPADELNQISIPPADELNHNFHNEPSKNIVKSKTIRMYESEIEKLAPTIFPDA